MSPWYLYTHSQLYMYTKQTPIAPCGNAYCGPPHSPVGKTLLEIATTYQSTMDRLLDFDVCNQHYTSTNTFISLPNYTGDWF